MTVVLVKALADVELAAVVSVSLPCAFEYTPAGLQQACYPLVKCRLHASSDTVCSLFLLLIHRMTDHY